MKARLVRPRGSWVRGKGWEEVERTRVKGRKGRRESIRGVRERRSVRGIKGRLTVGVGGR